MPFPTTPILDDFNRPDEGPPPSASWTTPTDQNGVRVVSNRAQVQAGASSEGFAAWTASTFGPDCEVYCDVAAATGTWALKLMARAPSALDLIANRYFLNATNAGLQILKTVDNAQTLLASLVRSNVQGESFGLSVIGNTLSAYYKPIAGSWTLGVTATDSSFQDAGYIGLSADAGSPAKASDNFGGGGPGAAADIIHVIN